MSDSTRTNLNTPNSVEQGVAPPAGIGAPAPLTPTEEVGDFTEVLRQYKEIYPPRNIHENTLVYELASLAWRLRRIPFLESVAIANLHRNQSAIREVDTLSRHESRLLRNMGLVRRELEAMHGVTEPAHKTSQEPKEKTAPATGVEEIRLPAVINKANTAPQPAARLVPAAPPDFHPRPRTTDRNSGVSGPLL